MGRYSSRRVRKPKLNRLSRLFRVAELLGLPCGQTVRHISEADCSCDCVPSDKVSGCALRACASRRENRKELECLLKYIERFIELDVVSFSQTLWINVHEYVRCYS